MEIKSIYFRREEDGDWENGIKIASHQFIVKGYNFKILDLNANVVEPYEVKYNNDFGVIYNPREEKQQ